MSYTHSYPYAAAQVKAPGPKTAELAFRGLTDLMGFRAEIIAARLGARLKEHIPDDWVLHVQVEVEREGHREGNDLKVTERFMLVHPDDYEAGRDGVIKRFTDVFALETTVRVIEGKP